MMTHSDGQLQVVTAECPACHSLDTCFLTLKSTEVALWECRICYVRFEGPR